MTARQWCKGWLTAGWCVFLFLPFCVLTFKGMGSLPEQSPRTPVVCFVYLNILSVCVMVNIWCLVQSALSSPSSCHPPQRISNWSDSKHLNWWRSSTPDTDLELHRLSAQCRRKHNDSAVCGSYYPLSTAVFVVPFSDNAGERAAPRRQQWHRRPGVPEPRVAVPQPVPAKGVPDPDEDHAGSGSLSDGPGESHPGRQLRGSGSNHITQSPALVSLLGRFLCEYNNYTMLVVFGCMNQTWWKFSSPEEEHGVVG